MVRIKRKYTCLLKASLYILYLLVSIYIFQTLFRANYSMAEHKSNLLQNKTFRDIQIQTASVIRKNSAVILKEKTVGKKVDTFIELSRKSNNFHQYPLDLNFKDLLDKLKKKEQVYVKEINPHPFHYILNPNKKCQPSETSLIILVKSAANHTNNREAIRKTWGNITDHSTKIVFLIGSSEFDRDIIRENGHFHDIVQENFQDVYWNNTHKTIMGFNWATTYCSEARHLLFVDDDYYVNLPNLHYFLQHLDRNASLFSGFLLPLSVPFRDISSKWYVSIKDYPFHKYPPYLAGGAVMVSMDVAQKMAAAFPYIKYMVIDDAYLGIVAYKLGVRASRNGKISDKHCQFWRMRAKIACHGFGNVTNLFQTHNHLKEIAAKNCQNGEPFCVK